MQIIANKDFGKFLTKNKEYQVIRETEDNYIIMDNTGEELGFAKTWFVSSKKINPKKIAETLVKLMLEANGNDVSHETFEQAKQQALIAIGFAIEYAENDQSLLEFKQVQEQINKIEIYES